MDFKDGIALVLMVLISSAAAQRVEAASPEPPAIRMRVISQQSGALPIEGVEEPRGVIRLQQVLTLTLLRNPELAAFSFDMRAAEARALQAGIWPNPQLGVEVENVAGTGSTTKGVRAAETTLQLSQLIELGGKRAKRMRLAGLERELTSWDYEVKRLDVLTE